MADVGLEVVMQVMAKEEAGKISLKKLNATLCQALERVGVCVRQESV